MMTADLEGALSFLQELLALGLQPHGPLLDGTEAGATAGGSKVKPYWSSWSLTKLSIPLTTHPPPCLLTKKLCRQLPKPTENMLCLCSKQLSESLWDLTCNERVQLTGVVSEDGGKKIWIGLQMRRKNNKPKRICWVFFAMKKWDISTVQAFDYLANLATVLFIARVIRVKCNEAWGCCTSLWNYSSECGLTCFPYSSKIYIWFSTLVCLVSPLVSPPAAHHRNAAGVQTVRLSASQHPLSVTFQWGCWSLAPIPAVRAEAGFHPWRVRANIIHTTSSLRSTTIQPLVVTFWTLLTWHNTEN